MISLRQKMYRLNSLYGKNGQQVIEQSQRLDRLLNLFQSIKERKSICSGKFPLGQLIATPGVMEATTDEELISALAKHLNGDWGEVSPEDWQSNNEALINRSRILSSYTSASGVKIWIITEYDRSITTFLLPIEY